MQNFRSLNLIKNLGLIFNELGSNKNNWGATLQGQILPTSCELVEQERQLAERERLRADRLAAKLRKIGIDPDTLYK